LLVLGFEGDGPYATADAREEGGLALRLLASEGGEDLGAAPGQAWFANRYKMGYRQSPFFSAGAFADTMEVATTWDRLEALHSAVRHVLASLTYVVAPLSHA